ncbi:unnamed protein product [Haemonchus placei]|uniref:Arylesterase n=1 Tax=Haemonchus placei TaxID=6290 RepID=A0A0N4X6T0_HAEPC|nr:unnamed protein product [Haemonchus placei]
MEKLALDINKRVYNHRPGACRKVEGVQYGAEDIAVLEEEGIAIITSGIVYLQPRKKARQLFLYDFRQNGTWKVVPLKINGEYDEENFHPHGISHFITAKGARLFVISHTNDFKHSVMVFDWNRQNPLQVDLVRTIKDDKFIRPNDLAAINEESFILTNDGYSQSKFFNLLEILLFYPSGSAVYYDGTTSNFVILKSVSPNGIIFNKERTHAIISHINSETVSVYKLDDNHHKLLHVVDVPILTSADNFCLDKSGAVWVGAHPVMKDALSFLSDFDDTNAIAPSQVLRIVFSKDFKSWEITEPFADDGRLISASSVAAPFGNQLLIGSVCRELVHCYIRPETV